MRDPNRQLHGCPYVSLMQGAWWEQTSEAGGGEAKRGQQLGEDGNKNTKLSVPGEATCSGQAGGKKERQRLT